MTGSAAFQWRPTESGHVIVLNGGSSSGKSSLAGTLQEVLEQPYLHFDADIFRIFMPERFLVWAPFSEEVNEMSMRFIGGFHRAVAAFAGTGNNVIVDHMIVSEMCLLDCVDILAEFNPLFVGVRCPASVAIQRELERRDRGEGLAAYSAERVHASAIYDLDLDSSKMDPVALAHHIKNWLAASNTPNAFRRLHEALMPDYHGSQ